jgi:hypothetical protein
MEDGIDLNELVYIQARISKILVDQVRTSMRRAVHHVDPSLESIENFFGKPLAEQIHIGREVLEALEKACLDLEIEGLTK